MKKTLKKYLIYIIFFVDDYYSTTRPYKFYAVFKVTVFFQNGVPDSQQIYSNLTPLNPSVRPSVRPSVCPPESPSGPKGL